MSGYFFLHRESPDFRSGTNNGSDYTMKNEKLIWIKLQKSLSNLLANAHTQTQTQTHTHTHTHGKFRTVVDKDMRLEESPLEFFFSLVRNFRTFSTPLLYCFNFLFLFIFKNFYFFISWRLITSQYCSGFSHTLT